MDTILAGAVIALIAAGLVLAARRARKGDLPAHTKDAELKSLENTWASINAFSKDRGQKELERAVALHKNNRKLALRYVIAERERENGR
jgi:hypothetical protein